MWEKVQGEEEANHCEISEVWCGEIKFGVYLKRNQEPMWGFKQILEENRF